MGTGMSDIGWVVVFAVSIFFVIYFIVQQIVESRSSGAMQSGSGRRYAEGLDFFENVSPFVTALKPVSLAMLSSMGTKDIRELEDKIRDAGLTKVMSLDEFIGLRLTGACIGIAIGLFLMLVTGTMHVMILLGTMLFALIGWIYPMKWITSLGEEREAKIFRGLSDTLDVLAVSVSAGLDLREALARVVEIGSEPILDTEIRRTLEEIDKGGKSLEQGFEDLRDRISLPEMTAFVNVVLMAFRLGASGMGDILMEQAEAIRRERVVRAERQANKMGSKILFPIAVFIFPAVIVTLLGPMALEAYVSFSK